jgi:DNA-binding MarR family transcriptional regulator
MSAGQIDQILHPPARLQIAAALARVDTIEFATLRDILEVSDSVLSKHLSTLADAKYVKLSKAKMGGRQRTWASFTGKGRDAFANHLAALRALADLAAQAAGDADESDEGTQVAAE